VDYIAHRIPEMMPRYRQIMETVHAMISEAFSNAVITPGETTTDDVTWWFREKIRSWGGTPGSSPRSRSSGPATSPRAGGDPAG
jgi:hypothetical protein